MATTTMIRKLDVNRMVLIKNLYVSQMASPGAKVNFSAISSSTSNIVKSASGKNNIHDSSTVKKAAMAKPSKTLQLTSQMVFDREDKYGAHNYHPLPVALAKGEGLLKVLYKFMFFLSYRFFFSVTKI